MVADIGNTAAMGSRIGLFAMALAGAVLWSGLPSRAADEPVATAPIPPPPRDQPATVPLHSPPPVVAPVKPAPKAAAKPERAAASHQPKRAQTRHRKRDAATETRKSSEQRPGETGKRAERRKWPADKRETREARREAVARRDRVRSPAAYRPRRYYYREEVEGPFPPPWYDRGPPFAAMPYPRGPMPPW
jgi:hypothetical protein